MGVGEFELGDDGGLTAIAEEVGVRAEDQSQRELDHLGEGGPFVEAGAEEFPGDLDVRPIIARLDGVDARHLRPLKDAAFLELARLDSLQLCGLGQRVAVEPRLQHLGLVEVLRVVEEQRGRGEQGLLPP